MQQLRFRPRSSGGADAPRRMSRRLATLIAAVLCLGAPRLPAQLVVVVNPANATDDISADRLKRLFLGQATTFSSGAHASLAVYSAASDKFDVAALGLGREIVRSRWMAMAFRGETIALPPEYAAAEDVRKFVRAHPDAIAYLNAADADATVKVLRIDGKRPTDPGYPLR